MNAGDGASDDIADVECGEGLVVAGGGATDGEAKFTEIMVDAPDKCLDLVADGITVGRDLAICQGQLGRHRVADDTVYIKQDANGMNIGDGTGDDLPDLERSECFVVAGGGAADREAKFTVIAINGPDACADLVANRVSVGRNLATCQRQLARGDAAGDAVGINDQAAFPDLCDLCGDEIAESWPNLSRYSAA